MSGNTLEDAIRDAVVEECGHLLTSVTINAVARQAAFNANTYLGRESNEGIKAERRMAAIIAISRELKLDLVKSEREALVAILREAQG